jgi:hypothetical protein
MPCEKHPAVPDTGRHCPACLLEEALAASAARPEDGFSAPDGRDDALDFDGLVIQVPLGRSEGASVFLVTHETVPGRLFRLKAWRSPAPRDFPQRFARLKRQLAVWHEPAVEAPLAACVDPAGGPAVLSRFRRGMPLFDVMRSGGLDSRGALEQIASVRKVLAHAHARGLAHGSLGPGNVMVQARRAYLLDFGQRALLGAAISRSDLIAADRTAMDALERAVAS